MGIRELLKLSDGVNNYMLVSSVSIFMMSSIKN